jgi:EF-P beta-lysylation protein EpmB
MASSYSKHSMEMKQNIITSQSDSVGAGLSDSPSASTNFPVSWREAMKFAVRSSHELCRILNLSNTLRLEDAQTKDFPVFAPLEYIDRMKVGYERDPLLLQVLPGLAELEHVSGFTSDPVGDLQATSQPGLIRKYRSRALLIVTGACAIHCRYCFRRHFPYEQAPHSMNDWEPSLQQISQSPEIDEVILSGGDPLTLVDEQLAPLVARIAEIPHVQRLRIHTRLPVVIPQRVTPELLAGLTSTRLTPLVVVHVNHAQELNRFTSDALSLFVQRGIPVLNQAVLLKGVNDQLTTLVELSRALVNLRIMPYYLHQLDKVRGAAHFEVSIAKGLWLMEEMRKHLPGYAIPRYVQEIAGEGSKRVLA